MTFKSALRMSAGALALLPSAVFAHPGIGDATGLAHGFSHPISGLDHILAMVLVGVIAFQLGGRALWLVPMAFVAAMAIGGALGAAGFGVPFIEVGIALSVVVLGAIVAFDIKSPVAVAMSIVGLFAVFHGYAHGSEMPENACGVAYAAGFMGATALLHAAGIALGFAIGQAGVGRRPVLARSAGGAAAIAGIGILTGLI